MENISVTGEFGRKPALAFEGTPSDELVVEVLRAGDGQVVEAGDTITCHYYGAVFGSATDFDFSPADSATAPEGAGASRSTRTSA